MTIDTKKDFFKVRNFLELMNKNKLYNYSIDDVMNFLQKLDKNKYQNIKKKNYTAKTTLNWNIYK